MKVRQILERKGMGCHSITPDQTLADAVKIMMQHRIGSLVVMEGARVVSIITERDIMWAVDTHGAKMSDIKVRELMAKELVVCRSDCSIHDAMDLMTKNPTKRRIRHLPVLDGDKLKGIISIGDIVYAIMTETEFENKLLKNYIKNWPEESGAA